MKLQKKKILEAKQIYTSFQWIAVSYLFKK